MAAVFRPAPGGIDIFIRLTPGARRDALGASLVLGDRACLTAHVRAVPEDGKANRALIDLLSGELGVPRSTLSLASGQSARLKTVRLQAAGPALDRVIGILRGRT